MGYAIFDNNLVSNSLDNVVTGLEEATFSFWFAQDPNKTYLG